MQLDLSVRHAAPDRGRSRPDHAAEPERCQKAAQEAGYKGEKFVILQPTDIPISNAFALVTAKACRDIGMNVDLQAIDWSTVTSRRAKKDPVEQGGWNMFPTWWIGGDLLNPLSIASLVADPTRPGRAGRTTPRSRSCARTSPAPTRRRAEEGRCRRAEARHRDRHLDQPRHFFVPVGYRDNVKGMIPSPVQFFWNMEKASA